MPPLAFTLALAAAVLHAFWNLLLARARDPESATAVALLRGSGRVRAGHGLSLRCRMGRLAVHRRHVAAATPSTSRCSRRHTGRPSCRSSILSRAVGSGDRPRRVGRCARLLDVGRPGCRRRPRRGRRASRPWPTSPFPPACPRLRARDLLCHRVLHAAGQARDHPCEPDTYLELSMVPAALGYAGATSSSRAALAYGPSSAPRPSSRASRPSPHTHSSWPRSRARRGVGRGGAGDERRHGDGFFRRRAARAGQPVQARRLLIVVGGIALLALR